MDSKENSPISLYAPCKQRFSVTPKCPVSGSSTNSRVPDQSFPRRKIPALLEVNRKSKIESLVHDTAALDDQQLSGHKIAIRTRQKECRADDIRWGFDSLEAALIHALLTPLADFVRH